MATPTSRALAALFFLLLAAAHARALIHHLEIREDTRAAYFIENFGFDDGGFLNLTVSNFKMDPESSLKSSTVGFVIARTQQDVHRLVEENEPDACLFNIRFDDPYAKKIRLDSSNVNFAMSVPQAASAFYNVYFSSCIEKTTAFSYDLELVMHNPGPNYLSVGQSVEPTIYAFFFFVYVVLLVLWVFGYMRATSEKRKVFPIHYLMTLLLVLKILAILFHALELHFLKSTGHAGGWGVMFYILQFLKGTAMFLVIALIGTGWAFIKPFLSDRDKKIIMIVIPLQVIDNLALIYTEAAAPGSEGWLTLQDIFRIIDIVCCIAVLVPVIWSIRHLKEASTIDGKAAANLEKLKMFRHYYLVVVCYIYLTRIIVYLLERSLYLRWTWVSVFVVEIATLSFYCLTGYLFRPVADNPYLKVSNDDADPDTGIEMDEMSSSEQDV